MKKIQAFAIVAVIALIATSSVFAQTANVVQKMTGIKGISLRTYCSFSTLFRAQNAKCFDASKVVAVNTASVGAIDAGTGSVPNTQTPAPTPTPAPQSATIGGFNVPTAPQVIERTVIVQGTPGPQGPAGQAGANAFGSFTNVPQVFWNGGGGSGSGASTITNVIAGTPLPVGGLPGQVLTLDPTSNPIWLFPATTSTSTLGVTLAQLFASSSTSTLPNLPVWSIYGNAGTNPTTHFIGTIDNQDFTVRTNNSERMRVTANGYLGVGTSTPTRPLTVVGDVGGTLALFKNTRPNSPAGISMIATRLDATESVRGGLFIYGQNNGDDRLGMHFVGHGDVQTWDKKGNTFIGSPLAAISAPLTAKINVFGDATGTPVALFRAPSNFASNVLSLEDATGTVRSFFDRDFDLHLPRETYGLSWLNSDEAATKGDIYAIVASTSASTTGGWVVGGNINTNPVTDFLGTLDAKDFIIKTSNQERARFAANGNFSLFTNDQNASSSITVKGIHSDGRWGIFDEANNKLIQNRADQGILGFGSGDFTSYGFNSAMGIRGADVHIPHLVVGGNHAGPNNISQLRMESSSQSEYDYAGAYPNGANTYKISTILHAPLGGATRAPIAFGGRDLKFFTGADDTGIPELMIAENSQVRIGTSTSPVNAKLSIFTDEALGDALFARQLGAGDRTLAFGRDGLRTNTTGTFGSSAWSGNAGLEVYGATPARTVFRVQGHSGQTAPLQEWRDGAGTIVSVVDASGNVGIRTASTNTETLSVFKNIAIANPAFMGGDFTFENNGSDGIVEARGLNHIYFKDTIAPLGNNTYDLGLWNNKWRYVLGQIFGASYGSATQPGYMFDDGSGNFVPTGMFGTATHLGFSVNGTETMRQLANGNVGIGTSTPRAKLDVVGDAWIGQVKISNSLAGFPSPTNAIEFWHGGNTGGGNYGTGIVAGGQTNGTKLLLTSANMDNGGNYDHYQLGRIMIRGYGGKMSFTAASGIASTSPAFEWNVGDSQDAVLGPIPTQYNRMILTQEGRLGLGTSVPARKLHIAIAGSGQVARFQNVDGTCNINPSIFLAFNCLSDRSLKKDIVSLTPSLEAFSKLNPVNYHWNTEDSASPLQYGFIAQEIETIFPSFVTTDSETGIKSVAFGNLIPVTVKAIQEMNVALGDLSKDTTPDTFADSVIYKRFADAFKALTVAFKNITADKATVKELCLPKSDGTIICLSGDQVAQIVANTGVIVESVVDVTPAPVIPPPAPVKEIPTEPAPVEDIPADETPVDPSVSPGNPAPEVIPESEIVLPSAELTPAITQ